MHRNPETSLAGAQRIWVLRKSQPVKSMGMTGSILWFLSEEESFHVTLLSLANTSALTVFLADNLRIWFVITNFKKLWNFHSAKSCSYNLEYNYSGPLKSIMTPMGTLSEEEHWDIMTFCPHLTGKSKPPVKVEKEEHPIHPQERDGCLLTVGFISIFYVFWNRKLVKTAHVGITCRLVNSPNLCKQLVGIPINSSKKEKMTLKGWLWDVTKYSFSSFRYTEFPWQSVGGRLPWFQTLTSINRCMRKEDVYVHIMEYYSQCHGKEWNHTICSNVDT